MADHDPHDPEDSHGTAGRSTLPIAPSLEPIAESVRGPGRHVVVTPRVAVISGIAILIGGVAAFIAEGLLNLIGLITNLSFFGRVSFVEVAPSAERLGPWIIVVPILGALVIGVMARFGSSAIRGHGIPEVMERILHNKSRISPRLMFLKPLSTAIAVGTGGPFGAEGPIIATGGAFGSFIGQLLHITADERKTLLAAGAAAGMAATFGCPVAAVLLSVELLLFEYRPRSIVPVALAVSAAMVIRTLLVGAEPMFVMAEVGPLTIAALASFIVLGVLIGVASVAISRIVYAIEDAFERLPIHWMWWPAIGAVAVGVIGYLDPRTLGVGYLNIERILTGELMGTTLLMLVLLKFLSWSIYLGSGTSGGTLAPLFIIGGGIGSLLGGVANTLFPGLDLDTHVAGLVGMAAIFAGASHAFLASVVFAFEATQQPMSLLPLLAGAGAAYLTTLLMSRTSIMTERLVRRGVPVHTEYTADYLQQVTVGDTATRAVETLAAAETLDAARRRMVPGDNGTDHHGFPVVDEVGRLVGVVTHRDLLDPDAAPEGCVRDVIKRPAVVAYRDNSLREAADHMIRERVGRLVVVDRTAPYTILGIITRSDLLHAHEARLEASHLSEKSLRIRRNRRADGEE